MSSIEESQPPSGVSSGGRRLAPLLLFLAVFVVYGFTVSRDYVQMDAHAATVEAWHIASTGSPWLEGDLNERMRWNDFIGPAGNGHTVALRMAGPVLAGIPFYWLLNSDPRPDHFSFAVGGFAAAFWSALTVTLLFLTVRSRLPQHQSIWVALAFAFATPTWTISADQLWTHTVTQLGLAGAGLAASRDRWVWAGVALAVAMLGRPHIALVAAAVGAGVAMSRRSPRAMWAVAIPTGLVLGCLAAWNRWMFGSWSIGGAYGEKAQAAVGGFEAQADASTRAASSLDVLPLAVSNQLGFWLSLDRGLLIWSPVLIVMAVPLVRSWRTLPDWTRWLLIGGVAYTLVQLRVNAFPGGDGFWAYRHGLELLTCAAPALALSIPRLGTWARKALPILLAVQVAVLAPGAVSNHYFVPVAQVWSNNSFWLAFRAQPLVLGVWLVLCVTTAATVTRMIAKRSPGVRQPASRYGQHSSVD